MTVENPLGEGWINIPTLFNGQQVDEGQAIQIFAEAGGADPETGRQLPVFGTVGEAETAAEERSARLTEALTPIVEGIQAQGRRNIQTQSRWITSPDEHGLVLMWENGNAVERADGSLVLLTWAQLSAIGADNPTIVDSRMQSVDEVLVPGLTGRSP